MNKKCCVVIITHKERLDGDEDLSFNQMIKVFGEKRHITVVIPDNVSDEYYRQYDKLSICKVNNKWLSSYKEYNAMCCNKDFYNMFIDYEYVLICQTDCWAFEDRLDYYIDMGYDWYGAPWPFWRNEVGNGGLSLRKIEKMISICSNFVFNHINMNEDVWFCKIHKNEMNICPWEIAVNFSLETVSNELLDTIKTIPMGFHGKKLIDLWDDDGNKFMKFKQSKKKII